MPSPELQEYRQKRDFSKTAEPSPAAEVGRRHGSLLFCVQKHAARRLHYDFRLEVDGVLKSWPIPKGHAYDPAERRLAVMTEDHPLDYASFEGVIPRGEYGGGQVIVWDAGVYAPEDRDGQPCWDRRRAEGLVRYGIEQGKLTVFLFGRKLKGYWTLVHTKDRDWLCLKKDDRFADLTRDVVAEDRSVLSGLTIEDLVAGRLPDRAHSAPLVPGPAGLPGARQAPLPRSLSPMLPTPAERPFSHPAWLFEPKLDGYRVIATLDGGQVRLTSRRGLDCTDQYRWLIDSLRRQPFGDMVLDGEVVALDEQNRPSFQHLQKSQADPNVCLMYFVFDLLFRDGYDLRGVPLEQRKELLSQSLVPSDRVQLVETFPEEGEMLYQAAQASGMEGIVAKRRDSRYETGKRSECWLKVKAVQRDEFVIGGYNRGIGSRSPTFGSLILGYYPDGADRLTYVGNVGSGFDDKTLDSLMRRLETLKTDESPFADPIPTTGRWTRRERDEVPITFVRPELVAEVKYAERTQDGILRAPVFLGLRDDKPAQDVRRVPVVPPPAPDVLEQVRQSEADKLVVQVDGYEIALSNLNKVFWPAHGDQRALTKRDLVVYYAEVAHYLLPHTRDRPLTLVRFPNGIAGQHFYQKHLEKGLPPFVETVRLYSDHVKGDGEYLLINNLATLLWLGQLADLELHTWYSRVNPQPDAVGRPTVFAGSLETMQASVLNYPDFVVFDLDPYLYSGKEARGAEPELHPEGFQATCEVALWLKEMLDGLGLTSFVKTTGKTGLHIYVPIVRSLDYESTHSISETLARYLVQQHPEQVTAEWAVPKRKGKVFADYNQNVRGKTLASIYSPRVLPWAAVSMPLRWDEVGKVFPTDFTILTACERLRQVGDLWAPILDSKRDIGALLGLSTSVA